MRKAQYIVAALLEASPSGTTLRFGPGDDPYGEELFSFEAALEGQDAADMLQRGYSFATQKNPGDIGVYSLKPQIYLPERGAELIGQTFGLDQEAKVNFSNQAGAPGKPIPLKDVFRERPANKNSHVEEPKTERENAVKAVGVAAQPADEPQEMMQPEPEREAYVQSLQGKPVARNLPLDFGMQVDVTWNKGGVLVSHVIPGGPAYQAGLQTGDRITMVNFETGEGVWGPYKIRTLDEFKYLRSLMDPKYTVGIKYIRGGHEYPAGIRFQEIEPHPVKTLAQAMTQGPEKFVGQDEAQAYSRAWDAMEKAKADLPNLTIGQLSAGLRIKPELVRGILRRIGAQTRDFTPSDQQPNEPEPTSVTGNQPANPSALT